MILDQRFELFELAEYFILVFHEVYPCIPRKIINERKIVYIPTLLALQETPLVCSLRMPGNFNIFNGFVNGSSQMTNKTSLTQDMHDTQSNR